MQPRSFLGVRLLVGWCKTLYQKCRKGIRWEVIRSLDPGRECEGWSKISIMISGSQTKGISLYFEEAWSSSSLLINWHTSYLSRAPRAVPVEKIWSCGEICPHDRWSGGVILHMTDCHVEKFSTWEMWRKSEMRWTNVYNLWCFVAFYNILLQNQFCCDFRGFVAKSVLVQFMRFCVEKIAPKIVPVVEKKYA